MKFERLKLATSNENKIREFQKIVGNIIEVVKDRDLPEVKGTIDEVIIHKALDAGKDFVVEDTVLIVNGKEIVDIRWKLNELKEGDEARWITSIGYNDGENIKIFRGTIDGLITKRKGDEGFAFDPFFVPIENNPNQFTLKELDVLGAKNNYSARNSALNDFTDNMFYDSINIENISEWKGEYQGDY